MTTSTVYYHSQKTRISLPHIHLLLTVQTVVVILVSANRLGPWTAGYVAANEFLRWVDLLNMLVLPLISLVAFYLLKKEVEKGVLTGHGRVHLLLNLAFIVGVYVLGASYGAHEVTNYLQGRFCPEGAIDALCRIIIFNDDAFSHWLFFTGFVLMNAALLLLPVIFPYTPEIGRRDLIFLVVNGLFIGLGVFANLAFEEIGLDLYVITLLALLSWSVWRIYGRQPLTIYYVTAYTFGLVATGAYKLLV
jgi:hypothetical protein